MTTIATDGKTIAADSQGCTSFIVRHSVIKLHRIRDEVLGFAGEPPEIQKYIDWVRLHRPEENAPKFSDRFFGLLVRKGSVLFEDDSLNPQVVGSPFAVGSGQEFAMGAMLAGASPREAVRIAIALDPHSGGKVRTMKC